MCPLRWTTKSTRTLAEELRRQGYEISHVTVGELLHAMGYSLQANAKEKEGSQNPDRDAQFVHLNSELLEHLSEVVRKQCADQQVKFRVAGGDHP